MNVLVILPIHRDDAVNPWILKPLAGRSALERTIDHAKEFGRQPGVTLVIAVATNDPLIRDALADHDDVHLSHRLAEDLHGALREALASTEEQFQRQFDLVAVLEPLQPFRPANLAAEAFEMLTANSDIDSVVCVEKLHGRIWSGDGSHEPIADSYHRDGGTPAHPYRELVGLMLLARRDVIRRARRVGERVGLLVVDRKWGFVDVRSEESFALAERVEVLYCGPRVVEGDVT